MAEPAVAARTCALCGHPGAPLYEHLRDRLFDAPGTWSLLRCTSCSLIWLDPMPDPDTLAALYQTYYTHEEQEGQGQRASTGLRGAIARGIPAALLGYAGTERTRVEKLWGHLLGRIPPLREIAEHGVMWLPATRGRLLDVGCGSGAFLSHMRDLGWAVTGVEPDPRGAEAARKRLGDSVLVANDVADAAFAGKQFDAITLSHVIEHLPDPAATLHTCRRRLAPGGRLVCVTPNANSLGARSFGVHWLHWDPPRHLHIFDTDTLPRLVQDCGFTVRRVDTPTSTAHFVWQASSLLERRGRLPAVELSGVSPALLLESIGFQAWEWLSARLRAHRSGEEVLVVAEQKPQ